MKISDDVKKVAQAIGNYYLEKTPKENVETDKYWFSKWYNAANKSIQMLGISRIEVDGDIISIYLDRPGIFIVARGLNFEAINAEIDKEFGKPMKIKLVEYCLNSWLYNYDYAEDDYMDEIDI